MSYEIRQYRPTDMEDISFRAADEAECIRLRDQPAADTVRAHASVSLVYVACHRGIPFSFFGVIPEDGAGFVWMLSTEELHTHRYWTVDAIASCITTWGTLYPALHTFVDCRYTAQLRLLHALGFSARGCVSYEGTPDVPYFDLWRAP